MMYKLKKYCISGDMCERHNEIVAQWNRTQAEVDARRTELRRITEQVSAAKNVNARLTPLVGSVKLYAQKGLQSG